MLSTSVMDSYSAVGDLYRHRQQQDITQVHQQPLYNPSGYHDQYQYTYPRYDPASPGSYYRATVSPVPAPEPAPVLDSAGFYYHAQQQQHDVGGAYASTGLNPDVTPSMAAFSQLSRTAGSMGADQRSVALTRHHYHATVAEGLPSYYHLYSHSGTQDLVNISPPYMGGAFRGRDGMLSVVHPSKPDRRTFGGRGHGRKQAGKKIHKRTSYPSVTTKTDSSEKLTHAPNMETMNPAESKLAYPQEHAPALAKRELPAQVVWCDVCRVACYSLEILEKHKHGKRHKRALQRFQETEAQQKIVAKMQSKAEASKSAAGELQQNVNFDVPGSLQCTSEPSGKRMKLSQPIEREKPTERRAETRVCNLCDALCDTLLSFEAHIKGKKHLSRIKRFQTDGMVYGPVTVHFPPDPAGTYKRRSPEPLFFGLSTPEVIQQEVHLSSDLPTDNLENQHSEQLGEPMETEQSKQGFKHVDEVVETIEHEENAATIETNQLDTSLASNVDVGTAIIEKITNNLENRQSEQPVDEAAQAGNPFQLVQGKQGFMHVIEIGEKLEHEENAATIETSELDPSRTCNVADAGSDFTDESNAPATECGEECLT